MAFRHRRAVLSLTTRFCLPHEGMTSLAYLSRGSAVVLRDSINDSPSFSPAIVTCQHVACPWLFPHYFGATWDWLQFVNENHVRHSLQLLALNEDDPNSTVIKPEVLLDLPLDPQVQTHESRDLALLTLADSAAIEKWQWAEKNLRDVQTLVLQSTPCQQGDDVIFSGHRQVEESYQIPKTVAGHFVGRSTSGQAFAWSQELLEEGMCGGAVVGATTGECVGMVEGIVPASVEGSEEPPIYDREEHAAWQMRKALAGHVAFIPSSDVKKFIDQPDNLLLTGMELPPHMQSKPQLEFDMLLAETMRHALATLSSSNSHVLHDINEAFVSHHLDSASQLAVALYSEDDAVAEHALENITDADRQEFLTLAMELRRLIEIAVRKHMTFLLPSLANNEAATSLKSDQMRQQTLLQSLPDTCQLRFQQLLELHWNTLTQSAKSATFALPRVQQLHWKVKNDVEKCVLMRLQTSDGETRTIYVPMQQFHQLRHSAATVLQEMNEVEAHPMMRLAYMEQTSSTVS